MSTFVVRRVEALGDVLCTTPIIQRIRESDRNARIIVHTRHPAAYAKHPCNVEVNVGVDIVNDPPRKLHFINLDMASETRQRMHIVDAYFEAAFGDQEGDKTILLHREDPPDIGVDWARAVVLHPNRSWPNRTLSADWWGVLARKVMDHGYTPVVLGTAIDHHLPDTIDARGKLTLHQQAGAINAARLLICGDSMMFTLVGATDTPAIGFCTVTRAEYMLPYRRGVKGWRFLAIGASVPCYGCRADLPPTTNVQCRFATNECIGTFDADAVAGHIPSMAAVKNE